MQTEPSSLSASAPRVVIEDDRKDLLVDRKVIFDSVRFLEERGFDADEIQRCLVDHFYVDLDLLNEALRHH